MFIINKLNGASDDKRYHSKKCLRDIPSSELVYVDRPFADIEYALNFIATYFILFVNTSNSKELRRDCSAYRSTGHIEGIAVFNQHSDR